MTAYCSIPITRSEWGLPNFLSNHGTNCLLAAWHELELNGHLADSEDRVTFNGAGILAEPPDLPRRQAATSAAAFYRSVHNDQRVPASARRRA